MADDEFETEDGAVLANPAARLRFWLDKGRALADSAAQDLARNKQRNQRTEPHRLVDCWSIVWDLDPDDSDDRIEYARRGVSMIDAGVEVRALVEVSDNFMAPHALEHFAEVEEALNFFMSGPNQEITAMMETIKPTGWHSLTMLDELLSNETAQAGLTGSQVRDLLRRTQDLITSVSEATDLSEADRLLLSEKLRDVEDALVRARITGTADLERAADGLMGSMLRLYLSGVDVVNHPVAKGVWGLAGWIVALIGFAADVSEVVAGPLTDLLGLPSPSGTSEASEQ